MKKKIFLSIFTVTLIVLLASIAIATTLLYNYFTSRLENGEPINISAEEVTIGALILEVLPAVIAIVLIAALVAGILSHTMAKKLTEPLMQLDLEQPQSPYVELRPILSRLHKQHKQLKSRSDQFQQIISSMNEGLVLLDEHGMVLSMNNAARKIFSVKKDISGSDFLLVDRTSKMTNTIWTALEGNHSEYTEQRNGIEYQFTVSPIISENKILGAVILAIDISERAFAERNRQEFTANVTHELKTPLQSIIGSAELLENGLIKPEDTQHFVGNIRKEATRLVSLINDIIRLSQLDENHEPATETVDLAEVAHEVADVLSAPAAKRNITLSIDAQPCTICGVRRYVYEILYNLCDNGIRYNVDGGQVEITISKENGHGVITVKDTGIGIPPEHQSRIFERFYRVDKSHSRETGGTGLGLSIVKHAVQYHGGKVTMDSEPGKGTTITVTF